MKRHRTTARGVLSILILALSAGAASASPSGAVPSPIVFPVIGPVQYSNDYGAARPQGGHEGNDIMAPRKAIAVAAEDGKVKFHTTSARAGCMLYLYGDSGTTYLYIHLNNDLGSGDDDKGGCTSGVAFVPGLKSGDRVEAGEPVGYVGDSGDAEGGATHLHFEIHPNGGGSTNPFRHLNRALRLLFAAPHGSAVTLSLTGSVVDARADSLAVKVDLAQVFPLGILLSKLKKPLKLALPPTALVDTGEGGQTGLALQLSTSLVGRSVIVLTEPAAATLDTQAGRDGAFSAARIVLRA